MTGNIVRREEWAILRDMDAAFVDAASRIGKDGGATASGSTEISVAAFDAVFG